MNISVKYKEQRGNAEAEVWLTTDLSEGWHGLSRHIADLQAAAKEAVRRQLCDCGCSPHELEGCCPGCGGVYIYPGDGIQGSKCMRCGVPRL